MTRLACPLTRPDAEAQGCGESFDAEPDAHGYVECPSCGLTFELEDLQRNGGEVQGIEQLLRDTDADVDRAQAVWTETLRVRRELIRGLLQQINPETGLKYTQQDIAEKMGKSRARIGQIAAGQ